MSAVAAGQAAPGYARTGPWIAGLRYDGVPAETRAALKAALLDTLAAAIYGGQMEWSKIVREWAAEAQPRMQRASAWGEPAPTLRAADAALTNGVAAHALEIADDYHNAKVHPGAAVIPAALALAEALDLDGVAVMTAIAAGYETMIRTALALGPIPARLHGWHLTGVTGTLGAAAAAASPLGLDAERTTWALGLAGTQSAGLFAFNADGAMSKRIHAGRAAHAGVFAAEIAARGYTGPTSVYEFDDGGILKTFAHSTNVRRARRRARHALGEHRRVLQAVLVLRQQPQFDRRRAHVARALRPRSCRCADPRRRLARGARTVRHGLRTVDRDARADELALLRCGRAPGRQRAAPAVHARTVLEERIVALAQRIELIDDPQLDELYPVHFAGWVEAVVDGKPERVFVNDPLGSPFVPLDRDGVADKARGLLGGLRPPKRSGAWSKRSTNSKGCARDLIAALAAAQ